MNYAKSFDLSKQENLLLEELLERTKNCSRLLPLIDDILSIDPFFLKSLFLFTPDAQIVILNQIILFRGAYKDIEFGKVNGCPFPYMDKKTGGSLCEAYYQAIRPLYKSRLGFPFIYAVTESAMNGLGDTPDHPYNPRAHAGKILLEAAQFGKKGQYNFESLLHLIINDCGVILCTKDENELFKKNLNDRGYRTIIDVYKENKIKLFRKKYFNGDEYEPVSYDDLNINYDSSITETYFPKFKSYTNFQWVADYNKIIKKGKVV